MSCVNVRIAKDVTTGKQKAQIVAEITVTLPHGLDKTVEHTHIVIDEVEPENWGCAGILIT